MDYISFLVVNVILIRSVLAAIARSRERRAVAGCILARVKRFAVPHAFSFIISIMLL